MKFKKSSFYLISLFCISILFFTCSTVKTLSPFPIGDYPVLKKLPAYLEGDFLIVTDEFNDDEENVIGYHYMKIDFINESNCLAHQYLAFTREDLKNDPKAKYFTLKEDFLYFENDSLATRLKSLNKKNDAGTLTVEEATDLNRLKEAEERGYITSVYPLAIDGDRYIYEKIPIFEIDLNSNNFIFYDDDGSKNASKIVLKSVKGRHFINVFEEGETESTWEPIILESSENEIHIKTIDFQNLNNNLSFYEGILNIVEKSKSTIVLDLSQSEFESVMQDEKFLETIFSLKRIDRQGFGGNKLWILVGLGLLFLTVAIALFYFRSKKSG